MPGLAAKTAGETAGAIPAAEQAASALALCVISAGCEPPAKRRASVRPSLGCLPIEGPRRCWRAPRINSAW